MRSKLSTFVALLITTMLCTTISTVIASKSERIDPTSKSSTVRLVSEERITPASPLDEILAEQDFESGTMPPPNWSVIVNDDDDPTYTWHINPALPPYEGTYAAHVLYDEDLTPVQDEWLISPVVNLTAGGAQVTFWWNSSYYWGVSPFDNYDLELRISTDGGTTWETDVLWVEDDIGTFDNYVWYEAVVDLAAYLNETNVKLGWRYHGADGAQAGVDAIVIETTGSPGTISGTVTSDVAPNPPIANATVEVLGENVTATTDASGNYSISPVSSGTHNVRFFHPDFEEETATGVVVPDGGTVDADMQLHPLPAGQHYYRTTTETVPISDMDSSFKSLDVTDDFLIEDLDITINITHTYDGDLTIWLETPWNQRILLAEEAGASGHNFVNTRFDDEAATPIANGTAPFTGSFRPEEELSGADAFSVNGEWTLVVYDGAGGDVGTINDFTLHVTTTVAADDSHAGLPLSFAFHGNYPNPFNASTQFRFDVARAGQASLVLYNITGQEVARLIDGNVEAGSHIVYFSANTLPSGLYFARFDAPEFTATTKVILLK